ncbi:MAG: DUF302 domain-containing protein [Gammaproteobacteria bacterium]|nr:DUF302 domain-containing protein [Gammaproteobacteria bacterium]NIR83823.1 DUF302 domain-containing protein [Gammaproteobacteria bacterium]NIV73430.1 DUF302 domain-containing protein [Gammaproteobacteria bacterium]
MTPRRLRQTLSLIGGLVLAAGAQASDLMMARSPKAFPEAMLALQESIKAHGYTISRVQRVDVGLSKMGYETDKYRVVFFGKPREVRRLSGRYPRLIPFLPLKVSIFAEGEETLIVAADPRWLAESFQDGEVATLLRRWERDLRSIMDDFRG